MNGQGSQEFNGFIVEDNNCVTANSQEYEYVAQEEGGESDNENKVLKAVFGEDDMVEDNQTDVGKQVNVDKQRDIGKHKEADTCGEERRQRSEEHQKSQKRQKVRRSIVTEGNENGDSHLLQLDLLGSTEDKGKVRRKRKMVEIGHEDDDEDAPLKKIYPKRNSRSKYKTQE